MYKELEYDSEVELLGEAGLVRVSGEIDLFNSRQFASDLADAMAAAPGDLMLDMTALDFMDSTALCAVLDAHQRLSGERRSLILVVPRGHMRRLFAITGLEQVIAIEETLRDAVRRVVHGSEDGSRRRAC